MSKALLLPATLFVVGAISACAPAPAPVAAPSPLGVDVTNPIPTMTPTVGGSSGLQEREPDLCGAKQYVPYLTQPGSVIPGLGITKTYRVVEFRGIEPQEYDPNRIVFRLDASGNIYNIDCG